MEKALEILEEIRSKVCTCCAVTMEPDDVEELIDKLEKSYKGRMEKAITEKELDIQIKILAKKINDEHRKDSTPVVLSLHLKWWIHVL
jgi:hypothetical protein